MEKWQIFGAGIMTLLTFLWGIFQFSADSIRKAELAAFEARKPYYQKQMDLCLEATEVAAVLASSIDREKWQTARARFWELYWGPLSVVETPLGAGIGPVEQKMVEIGEALEPEGLSPALPVTAIEQPSFELAHSCRDLIAQSWQVGTL